MKQINEITFQSEKNMTFVHINEPDVDLGPIIQIGFIPGTEEMDSIDNYKEVRIVKGEIVDDDNELAFINSIGE